MTPVEALEAYSAEHPETIEDLLQWPARRFFRAFEAWQRRRAAERIERQEDLHVAAMYANTNLDEPDNKRDERVRDVQHFYRSLRREILEGGELVEEPPDPQAEAFMRAARRGQAIVAPIMPTETVSV